MQARNWILGLVGGIGAWVIGYAVTFVLVGGEEFGGAPGPVDSFTRMDLSGWVFYSGHFVGLSEGGNLFGTSTNLLLEGSPELPVWVYFAVPVAALLFAGVLVGWLIDGLQEALLAGVSMVPGYLLAGIAGSVLFSIQVSQGFQEAAVRPAIGVVVLLMGLLYPLVLGTIGATVGAALWSWVSD